MESGEVTVPKTYKELIIELPCKLELLPDYIKPLLKSLQGLGTTIIAKADDISAIPATITEIHFSQQWKAEAWLTQQKPDAYDVWININNKRLDNWLHMSGHLVCGSEMSDTNPQITQMFLLAIQLFQRPLNVNTLLQYLFLPECPVDFKQARTLAHKIVREGAFCNEKVQECIEDDIPYLPFDLRDYDSALKLVEDSDAVNVKQLTTFLKSVKEYASQRAAHIASMVPYDARIAQLRKVTEMIDALLLQITSLADKEMSFRQLLQWAQALYEDCSFTLYQQQVGSRCLINRPGNMIGKSAKTIWCDFYGDVTAKLSTDFLSNYEQEQLRSKGVLLWDSQHESNLCHLMLMQPVYKTTDTLTVITCDYQGATRLSMHPLYLQLQKHGESISGDDLYKALATKNVARIDNYCIPVDGELHVDIQQHPISKRASESYTSLEMLREKPFDYFMKYCLEFYDVSDTDINLVFTYGYVAHEVVEYLFTANRGDETLTQFVVSHYEEAFQRALVRKGALLLLPEHHLDKDRLHYQLQSCVRNLADNIHTNGLTVVKCEQKEEMTFETMGDILITGYIDMLLRDTAGNDVIFDLKWTSKKDKFQEALKKNEAFQLALYKEMLQKRSTHPDAIRTAYFVMPLGRLLSTDEFLGDHFDRITPEKDIDMLDTLSSAYADRMQLFSEGRIAMTTDDYSDYKCFTI